MSFLHFVGFSKNLSKLFSGTVCSQRNVDFINQNEVRGREEENSNAHLDDLLWSDFDRRNSEDLQRGTARSSAIVEVRQYVTEAYISRRDNPLL